MKMKILRTVFLCAAVLWMALIFGLSSETAESSSSTSGGIIETTAKFFNPDFESLPEEQQAAIVSNWQFAVRKAAHFSEYAVLGLLVSGFAGTFKPKKAWKFVLPPLWCIIYAVSDEVHQHFVPGRACRVSDMIIDLSGGIVGTAVFWLLALLFAHIRGWTRKQTSRGVIEP